MLINGSVVGVLFLAYASSVYAQSPTVAVLTNAESALQDKNAYLEWWHSFNVVSKNDLESLLVSENDTVCTRAAWELYVVRCAGRDRNSGISGLSAQRFVGFCEGRFRIKLPRWFEEVLQSGVVRKSEAVFEYDEEVVGKQLRLSETLATDDNRNISLDGHTIRLAGSSAALALSEDKLEAPSWTSRKFITFTSIGEQFWVLVHADTLGPYPLTKYVSRGLPKWRTDVWTCIDGLEYSGSDYFHLASIYSRRETILVLGIASTGAYMEAFDSVTGEPRMRFVTTVLGAGVDQ